MNGWMKRKIIVYLQCSIFHCNQLYSYTVDDLEFHHWDTLCYMAESA